MENRGSKKYFKVFYLRRALRIMPLYAALLIFYALVCFLNRLSLWSYPDHFIQHQGSLNSYLVFLQNIFIAQTGEVDPLFLSPTWSVALEEQFYLAIPLLILFFSGPRLIVFWVAGFAAAFLCRLIILKFNPFDFGSTTWAAHTFSLCRIDSFCVGLILAFLLRYENSLNWIRENLIKIYVLTGSFFTGFVFMTWVKPFLYEKIVLTYGYSLNAVLAGFLVLLVTMHPAGLGAVFRNRFLVAWGRISYFAYLFHIPFFGFFHGIFFGNQRPVISDWNGLAVTFAAFLFLWAAGHFSWNFFEKKLIAFGHRFSY